MYVLCRHIALCCNKDLLPCLRLNGHIGNDDAVAGSTSFQENITRQDIHSVAQTEKCKKMFQSMMMLETILL